MGHGYILVLRDYAVRFPEVFLLMEMFVILPQLAQLLGRAGCIKGGEARSSLFSRSADVHREDPLLSSKKQSLFSKSTLSTYGDQSLSIHFILTSGQVKGSRCGMPSFKVVVGRCRRDTGELVAQPFVCL